MINPNDITTVRVDQLPPATPLLTDIFPFETLSDSALKKATFQDLVNFININSNAFQFEVKTLLVNQTYINDNFNNLGIGINLCVGWRIADELNGLVTIGQGVGYPVGSFGGSKDAVLVSHTHKFIADTTPVSNIFNSVNKFLAKLRPSGGDNQYELQSTNIAPTIGDTTTEGVSGTNKNMQPYLVALKIIKL
jgi:hypothetical protein